MKIIGEEMIDMNGKQNRLHINKIKIFEEDLIRKITPKLTKSKYLSVHGKQLYCKWEDNQKCQTTI